MIYFNHKGIILKLYLVLLNVIKRYKNVVNFSINIKRNYKKNICLREYFISYGCHIAICT